MSNIINKEKAVATQSRERHGLKINKMKMNPLPERVKYKGKNQYTHNIVLHDLRIFLVSYHFLLRHRNGSLLPFVSLFLSS
jgi:hypothetical protein